MTEYEILDGISNFTAVGLDALMAYLTVTSGYLIVAYLVGRSLTQLQNATISVLFFVMSLMFVFSAFGAFTRGVGLVDKLESLNPDKTFYLDAWVTYVTVTILLVGIFACLKFMWDVRHPKAD